MLLYMKVYTSNETFIGMRGGNMNINIDEITFKQLLEASGFKMVFAENRKKIDRKQ